MKRTPCKLGTIIGWRDLRSTVIEDLGGKTVRVRDEKSGDEQVWEWDFYMRSLSRIESCFVISKPRSRNNRLSTVFRNAALYYLAADGYALRREYSCNAIGDAAKRAKLSKSQAQNLYAKYFMPRNCLANESWFGWLPTPETQEHRYMALLLMAEIVKDL